MVVRKIGIGNWFSPRMRARKRTFSFKQQRQFSQQFANPGRMAHTPRAGMGDSVCRHGHYRCSFVLICQGNLSMRGTFLIRLLPLPNNLGYQPQRACFQVVYASFCESQPMGSFGSQEYDLGPWTFAECRSKEIIIDPKNSNSQKNRCRIIRFESNFCEFSSKIKKRHRQKTGDDLEYLPLSYDILCQMGSLLNTVEKWKQTQWHFIEWLINTFTVNPGEWHFVSPNMWQGGEGELTCCEMWVHIHSRTCRRVWWRVWPRQCVIVQVVARQSQTHTRTHTHTLTHTCKSLQNLRFTSASYSNNGRTLPPWIYTWQACLVRIGW